MLKKRVITGAFLTAFLLAIVFFSYNAIVTESFAAVLGASAVLELYGELNKERKCRPLIIISVITALVLPFIGIRNYGIFAAFLFPVCLAVFVYSSANMKKISLTSPLSRLPVALMAVLLFRCIQEIRFGEHGLFLMMYTILVPEFCDIFAYASGRLLGKKKLAPVISPNKTVEGSIGGVLLPVILFGAAAVLNMKVTGADISVSAACFMTALMCVAGQLGDLSMSLYKRIVGIKDFSNVFPGHGGVMDRFDSYMFALGAMMTVLKLFGGFIVFK